MSLAIRGNFSPLQIGGEIEQDLSAFTRQVFINDTPLIARAERRLVGAPKFTLISDDPRSRTYTLGAAVADGVATAFTLSDTTPLMPGDVMEIVPTGERFEVQSVDSDTTATVQRGVEGTTPAAAADAAAVRLIGNSRRGNEVDQEGYRVVRNMVDQFVQTWQFPVQVGGLTNALRNVRLPSGDSDLFSAEQKRKLIDMMRDMEFSSYYGIGHEPNAANERGKQKGIRALVNSVGNLTTAPVNAVAYKPTDLVRDLFAPVTDNGGRADILLVSNDFQLGLTTWGFSAMATMPGDNIFGTPIEALEVPFLNRQVLVIPCPLLLPGTAIGLTSEEVNWAQARPESWKPRGSRGDAFEGDWLASGAIELENIRHHSMVEGITGWAPQNSGA